MRKIRSSIRKTLAVGIGLLLVQLPALGADAALGKLVPRSGSITLNGIPVAVEGTVFSGDSIATHAESLALVQLAHGDRVHFGPSSSATLNVVEGQLVANLERGTVLVASGQGRAVVVNARGLLVRPAGIASYEVAIDADAILVSNRTGNLQVEGTNREFEVPAGKAMRFELAENPTPGPVGVGARNLTPAAALGAAAAIGGGAALTLYLIERSQRKDDIEEVCERIKSQISPSSAGANISCSF